MTLRATCWFWNSRYEIFNKHVLGKLQAPNRWNFYLRCRHSVPRQLA